MKQIKVLIERSSEGKYSAYMPEDNKLPFGLIGIGDTALSAEEDFRKSYEEMKVFLAEEGKEFNEELNFIFSFDVPSFLEYYKSRMSLAGLEKITGVAQGQLSHYLTGRRTPSKKTIEKIEKALNSFGRELCQVKLA